LRKISVTTDSAGCPLSFSDSVAEQQPFDAIKDVGYSATVKEVISAKQIFSLF